MFDWATETPELTIQLRGSSIWPLDSAVPGFRSSMEAFEVFASELAIEVLRIMGLSPILDLYKDGEQPPQHRMKLVHYPQLTGSSSQGCGPHTDRAEWLTIIHECGEAALEVEIDKMMVPGPPKPGHVIVIFGQPLEDCSAKSFTAGRHQVVLSEKGDRYSAIFFMSTAHHLSVADVRRRLGGNRAVEGASEMPLGKVV
ncbi:hypothetical protein B0J14DRAFT_659344 [Halenospora varia]|nr:hypothetical protein B0J14DRAFT_659344 [Halenospora varia]